jgi:hypothetical protein
VIGFSLAVLACTSALLVAVDSTPLLVVVVALNSIFLQFYFGPLFSVPLEALGQRVAGMAAVLQHVRELGRSCLRLCAGAW